MRLLLSVLFNEDVSWFQTWLKHTAEAVKKVDVVVVVSCNTREQLEEYRKVLATGGSSTTLPVVLFSEPFAKKKVGPYLLQGHLKNVELGLNLPDPPSHFIFMASNCAWFRPVQEATLQTALNGGKLLKPRRIVSKKSRWNAAMLDDVRFVSWSQSLLTKATATVAAIPAGGDSTTLRCKAQIEGLVVPFTEMLLAARTLSLQPPPWEQEARFPLEEFALPTALWFHGAKVVHICKVFWSKAAYTPSVEDLRRLKDAAAHSTFFCFKRVPRSATAPLFQLSESWLAEEAF
jgi:hypothetical protein